MPSRDLAAAEDFFLPRRLVPDVRVVLSDVLAKSSLEPELRRRPDLDLRIGVCFDFCF